MKSALPRSASTSQVRLRASRCRRVLEPLEQRLMLAADLVVTSVTGTDSFYSTGQYLNARANIANVGSFLSNTGPFDLEFWLGSHTHHDATYRYIESGHVLNVLQGIPTSDIINHPGWQIPADIPQASGYFISVYVDTGNDVAEENEANNFAWSSTFTIGQPDLEVPSINGAASAYGHGDAINVTANIFNTGLGSTFQQAKLGFDLEFYLGTSDGSNKQQHYIESGMVTYLDGGQSTTDNMFWIIPPGVPAGQYRVWMKADSGNDVVELDETNNWGKSAPFLIGLPDLVVPSVTLGEGDQLLSYGSILNATARIDNIGEGSTLPQALAGFNVSFYLGEVSPTNDAERMLHTLEDAIVLWLHGGQSTTDNLAFIVPPSLQPGDYRIWVKADSANEVVETSEGNNWASSVALTIQGARWEDESGNVIGGIHADGVADPFPEATPVLLAVYTGAVNLTANIGVNIYEDDPIANDLLEPLVLEHAPGITPYKWQKRWIPYRTADGNASIPNNPEYFFRVQNPDVIPGPYDASSNLRIEANPAEFGVKLVEHTVGTGIPLVLVHGSGTDESYDLYRWKHFLNWIESHPADYAEFDVWLWKHDSAKAIGFNGELTSASYGDSQAGGLTGFIYDTLAVGTPGTRYENAKVALVAHSQGGLVSRSFMNRFNPDRGHLQGEDVSTLITLGTPHHGSPLGVSDWAAALTADVYGTGAGGLGVWEAMQSLILEYDPGDLNLAWDNLDGAVEGNWATQFLPTFPTTANEYVLTPRDTNAPSAFGDPDVVYLDSLKAQFGTLAELNANAKFLHKLVAVGAYDGFLGDNPTADEFSTAILGDPLDDRYKLAAVTALMARMSAVKIGNADNPSNYLANDGLVPLQSALMLNLPGNGLSISNINGDAITLESFVDYIPQDMLTRVFSNGDGITDHAHILDTSNPTYWTYITGRLRAVLETTPPQASMDDPGDGGSISAATLNSRGYFDVTFSDAGGSTIDPTTILDAGIEFTLSGAAAAGVVVDGAPIRLDDDTYRYTFTGAFGVGSIGLHFLPDSFADDAGNLNLPETQGFFAAAPHVVASIFEYDSRQAVSFTFDTDISQGLAANDLVLVNLTTGQTIPPAGIAVAYDATSNRATFTFASRLPDGNYVATLPAGSVLDTNGNALQQDAKVEFFVLAGDADRDRDVDFFDFLKLRSNYGTSDQLFSDGDFDYDGDVDFFDFLILRGNYNKTLLLPPSRGASLFSNGGRDRR